MGYWPNNEIKLRLKTWEKVLITHLLLQVYLTFVFLVHAEVVIKSDTPFEYVAIIKDKDGNIKKQAITTLRETEHGVEFRKTTGTIAVVQHQSIVALIPQYPKKGTKYKLEDVQYAIRLIQDLPGDYALPQQEHEKWIAMEEILSAANDESIATISMRSTAGLKELPDSSRMDSSDSKNSEPLKNIVNAEELWRLCSGPDGSRFIGKSVIVEGVVDGVDTFNLMNGLTKPKSIYLVGASKPAGGFYLVKCEVRGPIVFLFENGNLYARYFQMSETLANKNYMNPDLYPSYSKTTVNKPVYFTIDDQVISKADDRIDTNVEFPLVSKGNRLLIAQKMKIVGMNRMGDLELVGVNVQKSALTWEEIQNLSSKERIRAPALRTTSSSKQNNFKNIFIEIE